MSCSASSFSRVTSSARVIVELSGTSAAAIAHPSRSRRGPLVSSHAVRIPSVAVQHDSTVTNQERQRDECGGYSSGARRTSRRSGIGLAKVELGGVRTFHRIYCRQDWTFRTRHRPIRASHHTPHRTLSRQDYGGRIGRNPSAHRHYEFLRSIPNIPMIAYFMMGVSEICTSARHFPSLRPRAPACKCGRSLFIMDGRPRCQTRSIRTRANGVSN